MATIDLPDTNARLAMVDENHTHHPRARRYWEQESARQLAFSRVTMLGFVRLLTNRHLMADHPLTMADAWDAYRALRVLPEVTWLGEVEEIVTRADDYLAHWLETAELTLLH